MVGGILFTAPLLNKLQITTGLFSSSKTCFCSFPCIAASLKSQHQRCKHPRGFNTEFTQCSWGRGTCFTLRTELQKLKPEGSSFKHHDVTNPLATLLLLYVQPHRALVFPCTHRLNPPVVSQLHKDPLLLPAPTVTPTSLPAGR